jgi:hypothetical protein
VSVGSGAMGYVLARFRDLAAQLRSGGSFTVIGERIPHGEVNAILENVKAARP